ncbi:MAG: transcription termination factor Rho [Ignavibacteriae bacterium]|nr:transcription termination factor Rho [Ignavibacteriota bacterium]
MSISFSGILEIDQKRFGFVRTPSLTMKQSSGDVFVPTPLIARSRLRAGSFVEGTAEEKRNKSPEAKTIERVNGLLSEEWALVKEFSEHEVVSPNQVVKLEGADTTPAGRLGRIPMRVVDLFCPVGKGQRALIVSPPKAGKTMLMQQLAHAISHNNPDIDLLVLLIDERPEEVTDMKRSIKGEVFASSSDSERGTHVRLAQLVLEYAKRKVEVGKDVVILLDSLTRLGRAFNIHQRGSGKTLSGGVDARALEIPKRIFGAARKCEDGGSLTIIATALIDTGSRMDELIFQEFKGTGNMELVLDRDLANERIFPAINLGLSGTRREELLFGEATALHQTLRRSIAKMSPRDAMLAIHRLLEQYPTNELVISKF